MADLSENLLSAWLQLSINISNERVVSDMPYNEALICNILANAQEQLTATDLCDKTNILKSQMNRTLNAMEERGVIVRERSSADKRQVYVALTVQGMADYEKEHANILALMNEIVKKFGEERTAALVGELAEISEIAKEVLV